MWDHWVDTSWFKIHIGWRDALPEGRTTQAFIDEQQSILTDREFKVLYEADFPSTAEDALIEWEWIDDATRLIHPPATIKETVIGVDVAEQGNDLTVVTVVEKDKTLNTYKVLSIQSWGKTDLMPTVAKLLPIVDTFKPTLIRVDATGVGSGVYSRLAELHGENRILCRIDAHKGGVASTSHTFKERFINVKAESYWHLRKLFEDHKITIPNHRELLNQLSKMKWELTSSEKIRIRDPGTKEGDVAEEKSPDYADSLNIACYGGGTALVFGVLNTPNNVTIQQK
jgi:hypothetical protein